MIIARMGTGADERSSATAETARLPCGRFGRPWRRRSAGVGRDRKSARALPGLHPGSDVDGNFVIRGLPLLRPVTPFWRYTSRPLS